MSSGRTIDRRSVVAGAAAAAASAAVPGAVLAQKAGTSGAVKGAARAAAAPPAKVRFFSEREFTLLDEIAEMIIPADANSGGARAAKVVEILDRRIGESRDANWRQSWRDDLSEIEALSAQMFGKGFMAASVEQRTRLLERISRNEKSPKEATEFAFGTIKWWVGETYYRTSIGIHDEMKYLGNVAQDEFSGVDVGKPEKK